MTIAEKLERPKSLTDLAVERIRAAIVEGRLNLGEQISEAVLAASLGISKTPVREALVQLKQEGLVEVHPQRGTFVFSLAEEEVLEICRFREVIETAALAEAMARNRAALLARLDENLKAMARAQRARDTNAMPRLDADFHGAILESCDNAYLRAAYRLIEHKIHALRGQLPPDNEQITHCQANHAVIVRQIREGDVTKAQTSLRRHIRDTQETYLVARRLANGLREID